ncbi:TetR/AcrR family transcriptional regulator [Pseudohalioglobus lutimaris]|uniref:TetR/AcrR family transcriptional regulator n=1 Tax=Pseudohalioglobus lutimaris TaxID=1737061 RepID=A0A2N5WYK2_9GAMM|nr:TetR/AcrR family transcriptional regulator [Pseudohalioglobus lutimaris]
MGQYEFNAADQADPMVARILDAGEECIRRFGIRRTSVGEVARVGKMSRGSIYRHFGDKDTLVEAVFTRLQQAFLNRTEAAMEGLPTLVDKVAYAVVMGRQDAAEGIYASLAQTEPETVAMRYLAPDFYARSVAFWPGHIEQAQAAGEISTTVDVATATDLVMRLAVSLVLFPDMGLKLKTHPEISAYLQRMLTRGLG